MGMFLSLQLFEKKRKRPKWVVVWGPETERVKLESVKPHLYKRLKKVDRDCGGGEELKHQRERNQGHDGGEE